VQVPLRVHHDQTKTAADITGHRPRTAIPGEHLNIGSKAVNVLRLTMDPPPTVGSSLLPIVIAGDEHPTGATFEHHLDLIVDVALRLGTVGVVGLGHPGGIDVVAQEHDQFFAGVG